MECTHIPVKNIEEFVKRIYGSAPGRRIPITGSIEVTARCNLRCAHCYINLSACDHEAKDRELKTEEFYGIIDQIADEGCLWLLFTGGEPFIRQDFMDIYTYAVKKGLLVTLFTNGTYITPEIADRIAELPPLSIEITLYGSTKETYESVTGIPGSYGRCMNGIVLLMERKLPLELKTMVMTLNKKEVWDMKAYAENLGLKFRFDPVLNLRLDGRGGPESFRIPSHEVAALDLMDEKRLMEWNEFIEKFSGPPSEYIYDCGAGINTFNIDPNGKMSVCTLVRRPAYSLKHYTFHEVWHELIPQIISRKRMQMTPCRSCELISMCGQCPGMSQLECGDDESQIDYLCDIAHMRAEAFGLTKQKKEGDHYEESIKEAISQAKS